MKVLLFLNGPEGWQTGIEDGFAYLKEQNQIKDLKWFYYNDYEKEYGTKATIEQMLKVSKEFQPLLIVTFHVGGLKIDRAFLETIKNIDSKPILVYDEGDMYGTWSKAITKQMKLFFKYSDVISIRGLGKFYKSVAKYNKNIIYTPHHNDIARFTKESFHIQTERKNDIILIGNRVKPRFLNRIRRLPGAKGRENFVKIMGNTFNNFKLYGNGWSNFKGNKGPVDFQKQHLYYQKTWITVAYEHYPNIPFYFSNRLPIALMNGSLYVCHYHKGYESMFPNCDFIFFFKTNSEAVDIINYLLSLSKDELLLRAQHAQEFALRQYHPNVIWSNFYKNVLSVIDNK